MEMEMHQLLLASQSTTRMTILRNAAITFRHESPGIDETELKNSLASVPISNWAVRLAIEKALVVSKRHPKELVLGADQTLICENKVYDKATSLAVARNQLMELRGKEHRLQSAAAICLGGECIWSAVDQAILTMRSFSEQFLDAYLKREGDQLLLSVGSYRIESMGTQLFSRISGDYFTILGLPLWPLLDFLRRSSVLAT